MRGVKMHGPLEERATLERMRGELVKAENALAENALAENALTKADAALEEASRTAQSLGSSGTEWNEGGIKPIRDLLSPSSIKPAREQLARLITSVDDRIVGPGD
jgi:hypothetical protein